MAVAEGMEQYDRRIKLEAFNRARSSLARSVALLLIEAGFPPGEPVLDWVTTLEAKLSPSLAGLARWAEGLGKSR